MTIAELVRMNQESIIRVITLCASVASAQQAGIETQQVPNVRAAMLMHAQCLQTIHILNRMLQLAGVTHEDALKLAAEMDREQAAMATLKGQRDA